MIVRAAALVSTLTLAGALPSLAPAILSPPAGWNANPQFAGRPLPTIWRRDFGDAESTSWISVVPLSIASATVEKRLLQRLRPEGATVSLASAQLCGGSGEIADVRWPQSGTDLEIAFESSSATSYLVGYSRPQSVEDDPLAEAFVRNACPASVNAVATLIAPTGWNLVPQQRVVAGWTGPNQTDSIMEVISLASPTAQENIDVRLLQFSSSDMGYPDVTVTREPGFTVCGRRAAEAVFVMKASATDIHADIVSVQTPDTAYTLTYTTVQPAFDPKAIAAMHAFCPA